MSRPKRRAAQKVTTYSEKEFGDEKEFRATVSRPSTRSREAGSRPSSSRGSVVSSTASGSATGSTTVTSGANGSSKDTTQSQGSDIPNNWQPGVNAKFPSLMNVSRASFADKERTVVKLDNNTTITANDHIYMVSEPPSEPYYIARIMGFVRKRNLKSTANLDAVENYEIKVNWYYRPRDILKQSSDSRLIYASMHSDLCPITSFRGKVVVKHRDDIANLAEFRTHEHHFWFEKLFDRYMIKYYDIFPTYKLTNLPKSYQKALNKRFEYVFVETGRGQDLLVMPKNCDRCDQWCSSTDSVECAKCQKWYHMLCLTPPLLKKPTRGYSWSCARCSLRAELLEHERAGIDSVQSSSVQQELLESSLGPVPASASSMASSSVASEPSSDLSSVERESSNLEQLAANFLKEDRNLTLEERRKREEWPMRYLGMHARLEDALDLEDRPYPRNSSRMGTKHQASVSEWYGHPEVYYDDDSLQSKKKTKTKRKSAREKQQEIQDQESRSQQDPNAPNTKPKKLELPPEFKNVPKSEYPPWLKPRPSGYLERGLDDGSTSTLMWKQPPKDSSLTNEIDFFVFKKCRSVAKELKIFPNTPNFLDAIFKTLLDTNFDFDESFKRIKSLTRQDLKEPTFTDEEVKRFEDGVRMYGSELLPVHKHVKSQRFGMIVRFYYLWKKTPNGHLIWDNFEGRKNKKARKTTSNSEYVDTIADPDDDSSYDVEASHKQKRVFECKHCNTTQSRKWFRAPGHRTAPSDTKEKVISLCQRCARLWRNYAVVWEDPVEISKKLAQKTGSKKKIEQELINDTLMIMSEKEKHKNRKRKASPVVEEPVSSGNGGNKKIKKIVVKKIKEEPHEVVGTNGGSSGSSSGNGSGNGNGSGSSSSVAVKKIEVKKEQDPKKVPEGAKGAARSSNTNGKSLRLTLGKSSKGSSSSGAAKHHSRDKLSSISSETSPDAGSTFSLDESSRSSTPVFAYNNNYTYNFATSPIGTLTDAKDEFSFPLSPRPKSSNSKDSPTIKHIISTNGLFSPSKRPCCVCRLPNDLDDVLICSNCGLNVHASCYGVKVSKGRNYLKEWNCDCCSNDLHPVCNTFYGCSLCYSKEIDHDNAIIGAPSAFPDALKRTISFNWCHVICALFNKEIMFEDAKTMQGVINVPKTLLRFNEQECGVCGGPGGSLVNCTLCRNKVHVTCAQDSANYQLGFKITHESDIDNFWDESSGMKVVKCIETGLSGVPEPVLICDGHNDGNVEGFVSLREKCVVKGDANCVPKALIQLYGELYKQWDGVHGVALRDTEFQETKKALVISQSTDDILGALNDDKDTEMPSFSEPAESCHKSHYCKVITTSNWWEDNQKDASEKREKCTFCEKAEQETSEQKSHFKGFSSLKFSGKLYGFDG